MLDGKQQFSWPKAIKNVLNFGLKREFELEQLFFAWKVKCVATVIRIEIFRFTYTPKRKKLEKVMEWW